MAIDCLPHQVRLGWRLHSAMLVVVTAAMVHAAAMHYLHPPAGGYGVAAEATAVAHPHARHGGGAGGGHGGGGASAAVALTHHVYTHAHDLGDGSKLDGSKLDGSKLGDGSKLDGSGSGSGAEHHRAHGRPPPPLPSPPHGAARMLLDKLRME